MLIASICTFNYTISAGINGSWAIFFLILSMTIAPLWFLKAYRCETMANQTVSNIISAKKKSEADRMIRYGSYTETPVKNRRSA